MNQHRRLRRLQRAIARAAAETDAPEARCYVALADAARAYFFANDWAGTAEIALRGQALWRDAGRGHTWEVDLFDQFIGWAHLTAGDYRVTADHADRVLRSARRRGDRFIEVGFRVQFPQRYMLDDRPGEGMRDVDDALASWPVPDDLEQISNQFYWAWRGRTMLAIYSGRALADAAALDDGWRRIAHSLLWKVPAVRLDVSVWAGACSLARAAEVRRTDPAQLRTHIADARRHLRTIAVNPLPAHASSAQLFRAVIAHLEGNNDRAVAALRLALQLLDELGMIGPGMAARWQLGRLLGGDEGAALLDASRRWFNSIGTRNPERMAACGMPGIGD
jgi:hypothetical protein